MAISRVWRGWAARADAGEYERLVTQEVLPGMSRLGGYRGARLLKRDADHDQVEFLVITEWESFDSIRDFAGEEYDSATIPQAAADLLVRYDDRAAHYERVPAAIGAADAAGPPGPESGPPR